MDELLKKIPPEICWAITAKALTGLVVLRLMKARPLLGMEKGIIAPVRAWEKFLEINAKIWGESGRKFLPWVEQMFNMPVDDVIGTAKLRSVAATLVIGPELKYEFVEETRDRIVIKTPICTWMERLKELIENPEYIHIPDLSSCAAGCQAWNEEGLKAIDPKLNFKLTKAMPRGDPYCEIVIEFQEE
jgi:hypothetical protein